MNKREVQPAMTLIPRALATTEDGMTLYELSEVIGIHPRNLRVYVRLLREREAVRITAWGRNGSNAPMPIYGVGPGKDANRPKRVVKGASKHAWYERYRTILIHKKRNARAGGAIKASPLDILSVGV